MISFMDVYDVFLSKVSEDEWSHSCSKEDLEWMVKDWEALLKTAISYFKFPRCRLDFDDNKKEFTDSAMSESEVQVLATYMKQEWLKRTVKSWKNIEAQYSEADFSQANLLKQLIEVEKQVVQEAKEKESIYYRSPNKRPFSFKQLSGGGRRGRTSR